MGDGKKAIPYFISYIAIKPIHTTNRYNIIEFFVIFVNFKDIGINENYYCRSR